MPGLNIREIIDPQFMSRFQNLELIARLIVRGFISGLHKSPHKGFSVDFNRYRNYSEGDGLKSIDWKVFSRTDKLYVKQYEEETNLSCYIILDISSSMAVSPGVVSKLAYGIHLTAALTLLMLRQRDSVGLALFNEHLLRYIPARSRLTQFYNILRNLENVLASGRTEFPRVFTELTARIHKRSLIILISDLMKDSDTIIQTVKNIRFQKNEVIVFHLWDQKEKEFPYRGRIEFKDVETGKAIRVQADAVRDEYRKAVKAVQKSYYNEWNASGIDYISMSTAQSYVDALYTYLKRRERLR